MPEVGTPYCFVPLIMNIFLKACLHPPPLASMPSIEVYTYPYIPTPVVPSPPVVQTEVNPGMLFTQSLLVQSFDDQKERKKENRIHHASEEY